MRRLLLIAYHFPPEPAAGARRPGYLARYLPEFGWEATVLTRPLGGSDIACDVITAAQPGTRLETAVRGALGGRERNGNGSPRQNILRSLLRTAKDAVLFPDRAVPWLPGACARALRACRAQPFDAILSTAMPASVHLAGAAVARACSLPWIADYRDLWTGNPYVARGRMRAALEAALERNLLRRASAVTTVSAALTIELEALHGRHVDAIPNGFDPAEWTAYAEVEPQAFELCYTGSMYDGARSPELLFRALASLREDGDPAAKARVSFYGPNSDGVGELASRCGVADLVEQHGVVPRDRALRAQRSASDLLVFLSMDPATSRELGSKIYEYAGARRPVLAFGPRDSAVREYVDRHDSGWFASDVDEAKRALRQAHRRFAAGDRELRGLPDGVGDARDLARRFAVLLDAALAARAPVR